MKYSEDIKLEIGGKFLNGDYHKNLKLLTKDLDKLIKSAKSEQLLIANVVERMEKSWIKKTISVDLGKEDYIIALMSKIGFKEEERKITGGYMSNERIQITFGGYNTDYHENDYVKVKSDTQGYFFFYSLRYPDGYFTNSEENFKNVHDKVKRIDFEICSFFYGNV